MVHKKPVAFASKPDEYAAQPVPSLAEFEQLWVAWDMVTRDMVPQEDLLSKPIKLRNACIFYLGHIPAFLDIHLTRATGGNPTPPIYYHRVFERGIDPDVDNPEQCHAHRCAIIYSIMFLVPSYLTRTSEIPEEWPSAVDLLCYQQNVRARTRSFYDAHGVVKCRKIGRALWLGFEHEGKQVPLLRWQSLICYL